MCVCMHTYVCDRGWCVCAHVGSFEAAFYRIKVPRPDYLFRFNHVKPLKLPLMKEGIHS